MDVYQDLTDELSRLGVKRKPRILLVDDDPLNIQIIYRAFAADCQVFMAASGARALEFCETQTPDLVLLDIEMPGMDGFETCRRLREGMKQDHFPIIFVTSHSDAATEERGLEAGAVDFVSKPVNTSVLRARVRTHLMLKLQSDILRDLAFLDGLTSLFNRRYFDRQLDQECARAGRLGAPLSLLLLDVDQFKAYNDNYGHLAGDDCLRAIAGVLRSSLRRGTDISARFGGEEFVCLLSDTDSARALELAGLIEAKIRELAMPHEASDVASVVTVSIGVATAGAAPCTPDDLVGLADRLMYQAKGQGRARICAGLVEPTPQPAPDRSAPTG